MFFWVIGPSLPGLSTRTMTTRFTGCCCAAVAVEPALWSVVAVATGSGGGTSAAGAAGAPLSGEGTGRESGGVELAGESKADAAARGAVAGLAVGPARAVGAQKPNPASATRTIAMRCQMDPGSAHVPRNLDFTAQSH